MEGLPPPQRRPELISGSQFLRNPSGDLPCKGNPLRTPLNSASPLESATPVCVLLHVFTVWAPRITQPPLVLRHDFTLTNTSSGPITITRARANCGCTEFTTPNTVIPAGGQGVIPVALSLENTGRRTGGVHLEFDNGERVDLSMTANATRLRTLSLNHCTSLTGLSGLEDIESLEAFKASNCNGLSDLDCVHK